MAYKVLWLSNCILTQDKTKSTGSWLQTMAQSIVNSDIQLYNITQTHVKSILCTENDNIKQWILPIYKLSNGLPSKNHIESIIGIIKEVNPDLIHIWGVEAYWGLLKSRGYLYGYKCVLDMQGIKGSCVDVFFGGVSIKELVSATSIKEILYPKLSIIASQHAYSKWHKYEKEILSAMDYISIQSDWVRAHIKPYVNNDVEILETKIAVRSDFLNASPWKFHSNKKATIFVMSSEGKPYKGIHIAIKALTLVKKLRGDNIELRIAGNFGMERSWLMKPGYSKYLSALISKCGLENNVSFLGSIDSEQLVREMQSANVMVHPSFVESYSVSLVEAMTIGIPSVISFAGAMPELAEDNLSGLYYNSNDYQKCAHQILKLIDNQSLSDKLSERSRYLARIRNTPEIVSRTQMGIYRHLIEE